MKTFETTTGHVAGNVYMEGPRGVVLGKDYLYIHLFAADGRVEAKAHSHGYKADGSWDKYFRSVVGA